MQSLPQEPFLLGTSVVTGNKIHKITGSAKSSMLGRLSDFREWRNYSFEMLALLMLYVGKLNSNNKKKRNACSVCGLWLPYLI